VRRNAQYTNMATISNLNFSEGWTSISSNYQGTRIAICAAGPGNIYTGTVSNNYWTFVQQTTPGTANWNKIQYGPDGVSLIVCSGDNPPDRGTIWLGNYNGSSYDWKAISRNLDSNTFTRFIAVTDQANPGDDTGIWIYTSYETAKQTQEKFFVCFKEGTKILTNNGYKAIEKLRQEALLRSD